ncbi:MAG: PadR family transcriptional regulator [Solirubrobacteraceae bacterium]
MSTGHVLLGLLTDGERHGYELKREHDARFPAARPLAFGQVYATLERLRNRGLVSAATTVKVDGPERIPYAMTPAGREEFQRWLTEVEPPSPFVSNPLSVKVTLALLTADEALAQDFLRRQRDAHLARMREYTSRKSDRASSLVEVLAADYALTHLDADLRWIDAAMNRVSDLDKEIHSCPAP